QESSKKETGIRLKGGGYDRMQPASLTQNSRSSVPSMVVSQVSPVLVSHSQNERRRNSNEKDNPPRRALRGAHRFGLGLRTAVPAQARQGRRPVPARRRDRHRRTADRAEAFRATGAPVLHREHLRRRRQYRHGECGPLARRGLYHP